MNKNQIIIRRIIKNAIVLALYVALTFISYPIAFSGVQFRLSEILVLLCFFNRDYVIAITLGCFLSNLASPMMPWDLLIGTSATLLSCLIVSFVPRLAIASIFPIIANAFLIGIEYQIVLKEPYWLGVGLVAIGEATMMIVSYIICMSILKRKRIQEIIGARQNLDFKW